jgi:hypothetical protein
LTRRQDGPRFLGPEVWIRQDRYVILIDEPDHEIDVLPAYPVHCHLYQKPEPIKEGGKEKKK